jgi:hypothetical protein
MLNIKLEDILESQMVVIILGLLIATGVYALICKKICDKKIKNINKELVH